MRITVLNDHELFLFFYDVRCTAAMSNFISWWTENTFFCLFSFFRNVFRAVRKILITKQLLQNIFWQHALQNKIEYILLYYVMINSIIEVRFIFNGSPLVAGEKVVTSHYYGGRQITLFSLLKTFIWSLQFVLLVVILNISFM